MALKPPVQSSQPFEVRYRALATSGGSTLLIVGWIPNVGSTVPDPQHITIAPATTGSIKGMVPAVADALRMEIRVDLPDGTGSGTLDLFVNGNVVAEDNLTQDTLWTSLVM
jgi:hypothetical protein